MTTALITNDDHLLAVGPYEGIPILRPGEFLDRLVSGLAEERMPVDARKRTRRDPQLELGFHAYQSGCGCARRSIHSLVPLLRVGVR